MKNNKTIKHFMQTALQGFFGLLPVVIILVVILWLFGKIKFLVISVFTTVGYIPEDHKFIAPLIVGYPKHIPSAPKRREPQILNIVT